MRSRISNCLSINTPAAVMAVYVLIFVGCMLQPGDAHGQGAKLNLYPAQLKVSRLAPGHTSGSAVFWLDNSTTIIIDITATIAELETNITGPGGQLIDKNTVGALGGEFHSYSGSAESGLVNLPIDSPGFHYLYIFPFQGAGNYTAHLEAEPTLSQEVGIITQVMTDSRIAASLFVTQNPLMLGDTAVLCAPVFNGSTPVAGASVKVTMKHDTDPPVNLILLDDGLGADAAAGDGLYTVEFPAELVGSYKAVATIQGTTPAGVNFTRGSATEFTVMNPLGRLTGNVSDSAFDDNSNGLFDRIALDVEASIPQAGDYQVTATLKTAGGKDIVRSADANLTAGTRNVVVNFETEAMRALGEDGPYSINHIQLQSLESTGAVLVDELEDVGQTQAYSLSQFEKPTLALTGIISDQGVDDNGNGLFDRLIVSVQIDVKNAGTYNWSFKLRDQLKNEIDFSTGSGQLTEGLNNLTVQFKGFAIGASGKNGPYLLGDLLVFGGSASLVLLDIGSTSMYTASQFEGYTPKEPPIADTGGPYGGFVNESVSLDASRSYDPDGSIVTYEWDWNNDGVYETTTSVPTASHTWAEKFNGKVGLRVTDDQGLTAVATTTVNIIEKYVSVCSTLGFNRMTLDVDTFRFNGKKGEQVTITLQPNPQGSYSGSNAALSLIGPLMFKRDSTRGLPNQISATLPRDGNYQVIVGNLLVPKPRFTGDYCLTMTSSGNSQNTLRALSVK